VLRGKLDQAKQALHVTWSLARDVPPVPATGTGAADSRVAAMAARLTAWSTAADGVLARLQAATQATSAADKQGKAAAADLASRIEAAKAAVASQADARGGGGMGGGMGGFMRAGGAGSMLLDLSVDERDGIGPHDMPHLAALGPASQGGFGMDDERVPAGRTKRCVTPSLSCERFVHPTLADPLHTAPLPRTQATVMRASQQMQCNPS
jgi:hypothetical protein